MVNDIYDVVKEDCNGLDAIYGDYIIHLVGEYGLYLLKLHKLVETCGVVNGKQLYVLCERKGEWYLAKKHKIHRLNKPWYVADEYGHTDEILVKKVNELIGIINHQQDIIHQMEMIIKNRR